MNTKPYEVKKRVIISDDELNDVETWVPEGRTVNCTIQPLNGAVEVQKYGERVKCMKKVFTLDKELTENNAFEIDGSDYRIISMLIWSTHSVLEIEKIQR